MKNIARVYFPNLYGVRFFASFFVILHHLFYKTLFYEGQNAWYKQYIQNTANICVSTFFVLSSFLISYLLLQEKEITGNINIKLFYIRRAYRIWPLYYFVFLSAYLIMPHFNIIQLSGYPEKLHENAYIAFLFGIFLLPNISFMLCKNLYAMPAWTLGVEEPFYFLWPWLIKKSKHLFRNMLIIAMLSIIIKVFLAILVNMNNKNINLNEIYLMYNHSTVTSFPIGGITAWIYFYKKQKVLNLLYNIYFRLFIYFFSLLILFTNTVFPLYLEFYSIVLAVAILNMATNKKALLNLDNKVLNYLGKISYGIYMYHVFVGILVYYYVRTNALATGVLIYTFSIAIAILSYELFESKFLKAKKKYAVIPSAD